MSRVGDYPGRVGNLYFLYSVVFQSIRKAVDYFEGYKLCSGDDEENQATQTLFKTILETVKNQPPTFNERFLFNGDKAYTLVGLLSLYFAFE